MTGKELSSSGEPRTTRINLRQEQRGNQPLPNVWKVLSVEVKLHAPGQMRPSWATRRWEKIVSHLKGQKEQLWEKGSDYDRAVLDLYPYSVI